MKINSGSKLTIKTKTGRKFSGKLSAVTTDEYQTMAFGVAVGAVVGAIIGGRGEVVYKAP
jgi:hypothetical protein